MNQTIILPFNDIEAAAETLQRDGEQIAAVIVEVIPHNIGCVMPRREFLQSLRELTRQHGVVLIFDEVITGFRHALGGYQSIAGVTPDLATFAKAMANGYPIAALAGRAELMDRFGPGGSVLLPAPTMVTLSASRPRSPPLANSKVARSTRIASA